MMSLPAGTRVWLAVGRTDKPASRPQRERVVRLLVTAKVSQEQKQMLVRQGRGRERFACLDPGPRLRDECVVFSAKGLLKLVCPHFPHRGIVPSSLSRSCFMVASNAGVRPSLHMPCSRAAASCSGAERVK
jgi:hypothetical protein